MKTTEKDGFREFIRKHNRMRWQHRKWSRNTQKLNKKEENDGYDEKQKKNNEWWNSERGMCGIGWKRTKNQNEERINQPWLKMNTFKTEETKKIDGNQWKTEENKQKGVK